ncbi:MAG: YggT family protein [Rhodospirillales bacterium]|nr:YggT family protein [Rhodospirillales bacterium]
MQGQNIWWDYWYFHLTNYALAALLYTLLGRFLLGVLLPPDSPNYIYRWFCRLTDFVVRWTSFITPAYVATRYVPLAAAFWLAAVRLALYIVLYQFGLLPKIVLQPDSPA